MTQNAIALSDRPHDVLVTDTNKDAHSRLTLFADWLQDTGRKWTAPDLEDYRDFLLADYRNKYDRPLSPASVSSHLSTVRGRYHALLRDDQTRDALYSLTPPAASAADKKAFVDEVVIRLLNAIHPTSAPVTIITKQDTADSEHIRLTTPQASALLAAPGVHTLKGLRDTAIIALFLCTGIREAELIALDVADLRQRLGGELALFVRKGKGAKQRLVPYGALDWCLVIVDAWCKHAKIAGGAVFRAFWHGNRKVRPGRLSIRAIKDILDSYPVTIDGDVKIVCPHDLRRTYARRQYEAGVDIVAIRDNLGHSSVKTTERYIGTLDAHKRRAADVYRFDVSALPKTLV